MKHSTLTNPNDLHYSKLRTFTGSPSLITPDFIDQILSASDTNRIYRANGTTGGALTQLSAPVDAVASPASAIKWDLLNRERHDLQVGKKYLYTYEENSMFVVLPATALIGESIVFCLQGSQKIFLGTSGALIADTGTGFAPSPSFSNASQYTFIKALPNYIGELIYVAENRWKMYGLTFGSENYVPPVFGCRDPNSPRYNPLANRSDGSC